MGCQLFLYGVVRTQDDMLWSPPEVQPPQARGINAAPIQQSGPLVAPGTPRPGAQGPPSEIERLAQINLVPPR